MSGTLQAEIKQSRPFAIEEEAILGIARTAALLEHSLAELLRPHGITPTQYNALRILRGAGKGGLCRNEVRDRLVARVPDATRLLDRLEEMGLVARAREGNDRRFVTNRITADGLRLLEAAGPAVASQLEVLAGLSASERVVLVDLLERIRAQL